MQYQSLHKQKKTKHLFLRKPFLILYCIFSIGILSVLLKTSLLGDWLLPAVGIVLLIFMANLAYRQKPDDRKRLFTLYMLILSSIVFWTIYLQMFFSVNLFIERLINRKILGFTIPTTAFYALEGAFIILLGPLFAWSWQALNHSNRNPSPFIKFIFAIVFVGFAFLLLAMSTYFQNSQQLVNPLWVLFAYLLITIGEMLLSPIGLSAITLLSPSHLTGMMMGIWFVALGFGGEFAGVIAKLSSVSGAEQNALAQLPIYRGAFLSYSCLAFGVAIVLFVTQLFLRKILKDN